MFWGGCIYPIKGCVHHRVSVINVLGKNEKVIFVNSKLAGGLLCMM
jgi:hypothetical protein